MRPSVIELQQMFDQYNDICFEGKLVRPEIRLNRRKRSMGLTVVRTDRMTRRKSIHIEISVLNDLPREEYIDTLVHEMIHYYIFSNNLKDNATHGRLFCSIMERINRECGVKVTVRYKASEEDLMLPGPHWRHFCVARLRDGRTAISVVGVSKLFEFWDGLRTFFPDIIELKWYVSRIRALDSYPLARTPKLYKIDQDRLALYLQHSFELENTGKSIRMKSNR